MASGDLFSILAEDGTTTFRVDSSGNLIFTGTVGTTSDEGAAFYIGDDTGLFFGDDQDAKIEYDEDGTNQLRVTGADWYFVDAAVQMDGSLDLNEALDLDHALTAAGAGLDADVTIDHASAAAYGLDVSLTQLTTARTGTDVAAIKASVTSLAGDTGSPVYACFAGAATDGGGTVLHALLAASSAMDAALAVGATGQGGVTVAADGMTADPETAQEAGYLTVYVGTTAYQIPMYAA